MEPVLHGREPDDRRPRTNIYRTAVTLPAGSYGYKFVADGNWSFDPSNGMTAYINGVENSRVVVPELHVCRRCKSCRRRSTLIARSTSHSNTSDEGRARGNGPHVAYGAHGRSPPAGGRAHHDVLHGGGDRSRADRAERQVHLPLQRERLGRPRRRRTHRPDVDRRNRPFNGPTGRCTSFSPTASWTATRRTTPPFLASTRAPTIRAETFTGS